MSSLLNSFTSVNFPSIICTKSLVGTNGNQVFHSYRPYSHPCSSHLIATKTVFLIFFYNSFYRKFSIYKTNPNFCKQKSRFRSICYWNAFEEYKNLSIIDFIWNLMLRFIFNSIALFGTISTNRPRRQSCLTLGVSQSQRSISMNLRRWLAARKRVTRLTSRSISRYDDQPSQDTASIGVKIIFLTYLEHSIKNIFFIKVSLPSCLRAAVADFEPVFQYPAHTISMFLN